MNKADIISLLKTNDRAVARALVVLAERQTEDERTSESTRYNNGRGFRPCHARMGTSMASFYTRFGRLSEKQLGYWRAPTKNGQMRIEIYAGQLLQIALDKQAAAAKPAPNISKGGDVGNLNEERMYIMEALDGYLEGAYGDDNESALKINHLYARLEQINDALEEINRCEHKMRESK